MITTITLPAIDMTTIGEGFSGNPEVEDTDLTSLIYKPWEEDPSAIFKYAALLGGEEEPMTLVIGTETENQTENHRALAEILGLNLPKTWAYGWETKMDLSTFSHLDLGHVMIRGDKLSFYGDSSDYGAYKQEDPRRRLVERLNALGVKAKYTP